MCKRMRLLTALGAFMALLCLCACGGGNVKTDFYALRSLAQTAPVTQKTADLHGYVLALGPVEMPAYIVSRAQIIAEDGPNKLKLMENARWAEPLDTNIRMVLTDNLTALLNPDSVLQYPWRASAVYDLRVDITIFTLTANRNTASLRAKYQVFGVKNGKTHEAEINLQKPINDFAAAEIVAAQNRLIDEASLIIAEGIRAVAY